MRWRLIVVDGEFLVISDDVKTNIPFTLSWYGDNFNYSREVKIIRTNEEFKKYL